MHKIKYIHELLYGFIFLLLHLTYTCELRSQEIYLPQIEKILYEEENIDSAQNLCEAFIENDKIREYEKRKVKVLLNLINNYSDNNRKPLKLYFQAKKIHRLWKVKCEKERQDVHELVKKEGDLYRNILSKFPDCALASFIWFVLAEHCREQLHRDERFIYMHSTDAAFEARDAWEMAAKCSEKDVFPERGRTYSIGLPIAPLAQLHLAWCYDPHFYSADYFDPREEKAIEEYQILIDKYPDTTDKNGLKLILNGYVSILKIYKNLGDSAKVKKVSNILLNKFPNEKYEIYSSFYGEIHPEAYICLAEFESSKEESIKLFEKVLKKFPKVHTGQSHTCNIASYSVIALDKIITRMNNPKNQIEKLKEIVDSNFDDPIRAKAQFKIGNIYERKVKNYKQAKIEYQKILTNFSNIRHNGPGPSLSDEVKYRIKIIESKIE